MTQDTTLLEGRAFKESVTVKLTFPLSFGANIRSAKISLSIRKRSTLSRLLRIQVARVSNYYSHSIKLRFGK